ncbi:ribonuclease H-like domain-containing protein [Tanacetum coccineum]
MAVVTINALDAGNPLFLQNNDHSNVPLIGFKLTGTENYKMWSTAMNIALTGKNKFGFVDVLCLLICILVKFILKLLLRFGMNCNKKTLFKMDGSVIFNVINKIHGLKQGDLSVPKSNILARDPLPDVKEAFNVVSREESHRGLHPETGSESGNKVQTLGRINLEGGMLMPIWQTCSYMYNLTLGWIIDSGANQHLINSTKNMFNVSDISSLNLAMGHPNWTLAKISAIGSLRPTANVVLFDVLVIPDYNVSLMSVHKLIKDSKLFVGFDETKCYIQDLNLVKTLGTGSEADGLYLFDVDQIGKSVVGCANSVFVCHVSKQLWRSRLGHPADHVLSVLSKSIELKYEKHVSPCDICHKAKQTREPFPLSGHKSLFVGDLVHLDLWRPYRVGSYVSGGIPLNMWPECILTSVYLINSLPSSVLSGASPYLLVYGKEPNLSPIRCFGCLCYSNVLNNNDKFSSSEYESVLNLLNFFDNSNDPAPKVPNDDEREHSTGDGNVMASHDVNSSHHVDENATFATPLNENNSSSEGQQSDPIPPRFNSESLSNTNFGDEPQTVRRSDRVRNFPPKYNDYILPSNKKYGIEKHVNYSKLSGNNMCFASNLNKSCELKSFKEAILDKN